MEKTGWTRRDTNDSSGGRSTHQCIAAVSFLSSGETRGHRWKSKLRVDLQRVTPPPSSPAMKHAGCQSDRKSSPERISLNQGNYWPDRTPTHILRLSSVLSNKGARSVWGATPDMIYPVAETKKHFKALPLA